MAAGQAAAAAKLGRNHVVQLAQLHANAAAVLAALPRLEDHFARHTIRRVPGQAPGATKPRLPFCGCRAGRAGISVAALCLSLDLLMAIPTPMMY